MKAQFDNQVMSSFYLWFDNHLLTKGEGFTNHGSEFYDVQDMYNGYYTYAAPFKQLVSDNSIANATVISGVYVGSDFVTPGTNNLSGINYDEGQAYFSSVPTGTVSGNYAIKEYSVHLTDQNESELLFETKFHLKPKITEAKAGLDTDTATYPSVFLKLTKSENFPFAFGGHEETSSEIRALVFSDSQFSLDAVCSIFRDTKYDHIPLWKESEMPFNTFGDYRDGAKYNYKNFSTGMHGGNQLYISSVTAQKMGRGLMDGGEVKDMNPQIFTAVIDFTVNKPRYPRRTSG